MIQTLIAKRLAAIAIAFACTTVVPFLVKDRPKIKWVWDQLGPVIVNASQAIK